MEIAIGPKLEFPIAPREAWHVKKNKRILTEGGARRKSEWIPRTDSPWSRFRYSLMFVRTVFTTTRPGVIVLDCAEGRRLVAIAVCHSKPVCIDVARVVAMSSTVRLRSCIDFSLAAFGANRVFVKQAWCPEPDSQGTIVLETAGEPTSASGRDSTFEVSRMIAWDPSVVFRTSRLESVLCILLEPVCISASSRSKGDAILLDADDSAVRSSAWRGVRTLLALVIPGL